MFGVLYWVLRIVLFAGVLGLNGVMLHNLMRSIQTHGSVKATTIISGLSFFFSAVFGWVVFSEHVPWHGLFFILLGVVLVASSKEIKID